MPINHDISGGENKPPLHSRIIPAMRRCASFVLGIDDFRTIRELSPRTRYSEDGVYRWDAAANDQEWNVPPLEDMSDEQAAALLLGPVEKF